MANIARWKRYRELIGKLGMTQRGAANFLEIGERTSRRWASNEIDVPLAVMMLLELMAKDRLDPYVVRKLAGASARGLEFGDQRLAEEDED